MTEVPNLAAPIPDAERINRNFAGVGAAIGLALWFILFPLPFGLASVVVAKSHPRLGLLFGFLAMLSVVPGVYWIAKSTWGEQWRKAFPFAPVGPDVLVWTVLCILAQVPVVMALVLTVSRTVGLPNLPDIMSSVGMLGLLLGAPIAEELLFRGYGLARIHELGGERRALVFTALVFALLHGSWLKLPGTFAFGVFLGWVVLRTGSLWPALLGHFTNNLAAVVLSRFGPAALEESKQMPWIVILALGAAGLCCLGILGSPQVRGRIRELNASI